MGLLNKYRTDSKALEEGRWIDFGDPADPIRFRIAYFQHGLAEEIQRLPAPDRALARENRLPATKLMALVMRATSKRIILDWENLQEVVCDDNGNPIMEPVTDPKTGEVLRHDPKVQEVPYSPEKAKEILEDDAYGEVHEFILEAARDRARFREELLRDSAGN